MLVTGHKLTQAVKQWSLLSMALQSSFDGSLMAFPGDAVTQPQRIVADYLSAEAKIAALQTTQAAYNQTIQIDVEGMKMSLLMAIKLIGSVGRAEKMFRSVAAPAKDRYAIRSDNERDPSKIMAVPTISKAAALEEAKRHARFAGALRTAIAIGNAREIDMDLDPELFV
jgi:hypothetical protein